MPRSRRSSSFVCGGIEGAFGREGSNVNLVDDRARQGRRFPTGVGPVECCVVEDARRPMDAGGLPQRARIGQRRGPHRRENTHSPCQVAPRQSRPATSRRRVSRARALRLRLGLRLCGRWAPTRESDAFRRILLSESVDGPGVCRPAVVRTEGDQRCEAISA